VFLCDSSLDSSTCRGREQLQEQPHPPQATPASIVETLPQPMVTKAAPAEVAQAEGQSMREQSKENELKERERILQGR